MGGGGGSRPKPPPVVKPPPPVEEISAATIAPTIVQEQARQQAAGAYTTRGQKLGASGQVLGADPKQLASVAQATGGFKEQKTLDKMDYIRNVADFSSVRGTGISQAALIASLKSKDYQGKGALGKMQNKAYEKYIKEVEKANKARKKLGESPSMTI
tara:strand:- start:897 stop:1367 length:471 start_codon:yes stop_codon:yes gene_type:complete